jgi:hypothetical protein
MILVLFSAKLLFISYFYSPLNMFQEWEIVFFVYFYMGYWYIAGLLTLYTKFLLIFPGSTRQDAWFSWCSSSLYCEYVNKYKQQTTALQSTFFDELLKQVPCLYWLYFMFNVLRLYINNWNNARNYIFILQCWCGNSK